MINRTQRNKNIYSQGTHLNNVQPVKSSGPIFQDSQEWKFLLFTRFLPSSAKFGMTLPTFSNPFQIG